MAYTAPNDLFTSEEAILSLASSIADEDRTNLGNGTINGALDVLADALAERNVEVPPMNAGAILALADYVSGGGGSSDFTTAHVTVVPVSGKTSTADMAYLNVCTTAEFQGITFASPKIMSANLYFDAILYKGASLLGVMDGANFSIVSTSGAIQQMDVWTYMITGDCTITVEDI